MHFTLDSVTQVVQALKNLNKAKTVNETPVLITDLNDISLQSNRYYFGILTVGTNVEKTILKDSSSNEIITIEKNSQIVDFFNDADFLDGGDVALVSPTGHFRGFEITIR